MKRSVFLNWQASSSFGWGLLGLGILLQWAADGDIQALMGIPLNAHDFPCLDAIRAMALGSVAVECNAFLTELGGNTVDLRERGVIVVDALGNRFQGPNLGHHGIHNVARCIFEDTRFTDVDSALAKYDSVLCASHWNAGLLRSAVGKPVTMIHEGIDHAQFFPGPRSGLMSAQRFYVFSGGKIEFRKGHDLVLLAFREFAARHDDAVLVAAWHSPWPQLSAGFQGKLSAPLARTAQGALDVRRWVVENGIDPRQFIELPRMPNSMLPAVLREVDCALQVSRCEPCTNLPAKEAMACGVPVILADNTGTHDLVDTDNCLPVRHQTPVGGTTDGGTEGWGESSVEEIVAALDILYTDSQRRREIAARGARWIIEERRTWHDHAAALKSHLLGLVGGG